MSDRKPLPKPLSEMTPQEREAENLRRLREAIEETKSGILKRGTKAKPRPNTQRPSDS